VAATAHIEWLVRREGHAVGVIRVYEAGSYDLRSDYVWACTIQRLGDWAELLGVCKRPRIAWMRAIKRTLLDQGITELRNERHGRQVSHGRRI